MAKQVPTLWRNTHTLKAATDSVNQAQTRGLLCEVQVDLVVVHVVGDVLHNLVRL
jgi:hypothetical protein